MSRVCVAGFGLSLDGFSAGIEQSLSDLLGSRGRSPLWVWRACRGRLTSNSETISIVFVVCRLLARIGLELEIVNSDGCGVRGTN